MSISEAFIYCWNYTQKLQNKAQEITAREIYKNATLCACTKSNRSEQNIFRAG